MGNLLGQSQTRTRELAAQIDVMAQNGLRVIGVARTRFNRRDLARQLEAILLESVPEG